MPIPATELLFFRDKKGKVCGSIPDLVWKGWILGKIPDKFGNSQIQVKVPSGWKQIIQGQVAEIKSIVVDIKIIGFGISFSGAVNQYELVDAFDQSVHMSQVDTKFTFPAGKHSMFELETEKALEDFKTSKGKIHILNRIKAPRIRWLSMYWPPSKSTIEKMNQRWTLSKQKGEAFDLNALSLSEIEGDKFSKLWEPIIDDHPMLKEMSRRFSSKK